MLPAPDRTTGSPLTGHPDQRVFVTTQGTWFRYQKKKATLQKPRGGKRRQITTFSQQAAFRMLCLFNQIDWPSQKHSLFITLTYPDESTVKEERLFKKHNAEFWRRLEHHYEKQLTSIWRLEWKIRKSGERIGTPMPHFHYLLPGCTWIPHQEVRRIWQEMMNVDYVRTETRRVRDKRQAFTYVMKYSAKQPDPVLLSLLHTGEIRCGKHWGQHRPDVMPLAPRRAYDLPEDEATIQMRDFMLGDRPIINEWGNESFTVINPKAAMGDSICQELALTNTIPPL